MAVMIAGMSASKWVARQNKRIQRIATYKAMGGKESAYYQNIASAITSKGIGRVDDNGVVQIDTRALTREYKKLEPELRKSLIETYAQIETRSQIRERVSQEIREDLVKQGMLTEEEAKDFKVSYSRLCTRFKQNEIISKFMDEYSDRVYSDKDVHDFFDKYSEMTVKQALDQIKAIRKRSSKQIDEAEKFNPFEQVRSRDKRRRRKR